MVLVRAVHVIQLLCKYEMSPCPAAYQTSCYCYSEVSGCKHAATMMTHQTSWCHIVHTDLRLGWWSDRNRVVARVSVKRAKRETMKVLFTTRIVDDINCSVLIQSETMKVVFTRRIVDEINCSVLIQCWAWDTYLKSQLWLWSAPGLRVIWVCARLRQDCSIEHKIEDKVCACEALLEHIELPGKLLDYFSRNNKKQQTILHGVFIKTVK